MADIEAELASRVSSGRLLSNGQVYTTPEAQSTERAPATRSR